MDERSAPVLVPSGHRLAPTEPAGETRSGAETLNPQSAFTDHRFFPFGDYALRLVATGPFPVVASRRSTQDGNRTRKLHERMILRHARFPVSHLGIVVQEKGFEPSKLCY